MTEAELIRESIVYLFSREIPAWRNNTGMAWVPGKDRPRPVSFGLKGSSDIFGILPWNGKFLAIEIKIGRRKVTADQEKFMAVINEAGGVAFVARSVEDIEERLSSLDPRPQS